MPSVPGARDARRLARSIVLGDAEARLHLAGAAGRELRPVLARDHDGRRRLRLELVRIEVPAAGNAVDVLVLVGVLLNITREVD